MDYRRRLLIWLALIYICLREHRPSLSRAGFITIVLSSTNYNLLLPKDFYTVPINFSHKWPFFRLGNKCWVRLSSLLKITQLVSDWAYVVWLCSQPQAMWFPSTQIWGPLESCFGILLRLIIIVSLQWTLQSHMRDETIKLPCAAIFSALSELISLKSLRLSSAQAWHSTNSTLKMWKEMQLSRVLEMLAVYRTPHCLALEALWHTGWPSWYYSFRRLIQI